MKYKLFLLCILIFISCSIHKNGFERERIVFEKKEIGNKKVYKISKPTLPNNKSEIILIVGGHGHGFQIKYSNSALIYYTNDNVISSPNQTNYDTVDWKGYGILDEPKDTILEGRQKNGLYWKEVRKGEDFIGYKNITKKNKEYFDESILSFNK